MVIIFSSHWISLYHFIDLEWYWKCFLRRYLCQALAAVLALLSILVVWSELTFFNAEPVLSLFAIFVNLAKEYYDYLSIEVESLFVKLYLFYLQFLFSFYSWYLSPPLRTCAFAPIQRFSRSAYSICTIWHRIIRPTNTV